ncbi:putative pap2 domain-containing protein [Phaeoacremonium minimum UCRPA7]|uniref:Putative pap2 domain-containing protein n=1 Tax=Phaeoacremonium minimum (strain UCR-PA7) TaxID=1286976 RepID=R8BF12_PHAM7|nr:putative pap2 domain-containing protein [Phaeoacremonium minimum UCRPA7]EON97884.1 putative pap2 domain-containing protein [Phaeoacremonium minimum UCRPA7]
MRSSLPLPLPRPRRREFTLGLISSYIFDWIVLIVAGVAGAILGRIDPNKRPFSLEDPDISFPYTEHETVSAPIAFVINTVGPVVIIFIIALVLVPGRTVPKGTPKSLVWKRKLWELHAGWLGLGLSVASAWFITQGMKNLFGKPRPDLLARCQPDIANIAQYVVGGIANVSSNGQLVSAAICKNTDDSVLQDGFRSFPSGHASSSTAGLLYLSLFIASKFAITFPFLAPAGYTDESSYAAFPSRMIRGGRNNDNGTESFEMVNGARGANSFPSHEEELSVPNDPAVAKRFMQHQATLSAVRRQAAAPPVYLLVFALTPFFVAVFISSSRWFDYRHHGFDILFGFMIGMITAYFAFRFYHLPISQGAGWAWGPRSADKAWWAGVGSFSYATDKELYNRPGDEEEAVGGAGGNQAERTVSDADSAAKRRPPPSSSTGTNV